MCNMPKIPRKEAVGIVKKGVSELKPLMCRNDKNNAFVKGLVQKVTNVENMVFDTSNTVFLLPNRLSSLQIIEGLSSESYVQASRLAIYPGCSWPTIDGWLVRTGTLLEVNKFQVMSTFTSSQ